jgi:hypothetical protein
MNSENRAINTKNGGRSRSNILPTMNFEKKRELKEYTKYGYQ